MSSPAHQIIDLTAPDATETIDLTAPDFVDLTVRPGPRFTTAIPATAFKPAVPSIPYAIVWKTGEGWTYDN